MQRLITAILCLLSFVAVAASAEELTGKSKAEIRSMFGPPEKTENAGDQELWRYGESMIFFAEESVSAAIDNGDLGAKKLDESMRPDAPKSEIEELQDGRGWKNDWQLSAPVDSDQIVDEIIGNSSSSGGTTKTPAVESGDSLEGMKLQ